MKRTARLIAIAFLLIITVISLRYSLFTGYISSQKLALRQEALNKNAKDLLVLRMPSSALYQNSSELEWKDDNKELVILGVYHEVLSIKDSSGTIIVTLLEDEKENDLFAHFFQVQKKDPLSFGHHLFAFLNFLFIGDQTELLPKQYAYQIQKSISTFVTLPNISISPEEMPPASV